MTTEEPKQSSDKGLADEDGLTRLVSRLRESGIPIDRFTSIDDRAAGAKGTTDRDERKPDDVPRERYTVHMGRGLIGIDIDVYDGGEMPEFVRDLPKTFTVESAHGGNHLYFETDRSTPKELEETFGSRNPKFSVGETRVENMYLVGPGTVLDGCNKDDHDCSEPGEGRYEISPDREIAYISAEEFVEYLRRDPETSVETEEGTEDSDDPDTGMDLDDIEEGLTGSELEGWVKEPLRIALNSGDEKFKRLWKYARDGLKPSSAGFPGDRSRAESALSRKLHYYLGGNGMSKEEKAKVVWGVLEHLSPPKWESRDDSSYRSSVVEAGFENEDTFEPEYEYAASDGDSINGCGISFRTMCHITNLMLKAVDHKHSDLFDGGIDRLHNPREMSVREIDGKRGVRTESIADHIIGLKQRQIQRAMRDLEEEGVVEKKRVGQRSYWLYDPDELGDYYVRFMGGGETGERYHMWPEIAEQRREFVQNHTTL